MEDAHPDFRVRRTLVAVDGGLRAGWRTVKPLHQTGIAGRRRGAGDQLAAGLPLPQPRIDVALPSAELGIGAGDRRCLQSFGRAEHVRAHRLASVMLGWGWRWTTLGRRRRSLDRYSGHYKRLTKSMPTPGRLSPGYQYGSAAAPTRLRRYGADLAHWPGLFGGKVRQGFAPLQQNAPLRKAKDGGCIILAETRLAGLGTLYQGRLIMTHLSDRFSIAG